MLTFWSKYVIMTYDDSRLIDVLLQIDPEPDINALDDIVSAKLPQNNDILREKVTRYMMHNRNHLASPTNQCYKNGECIYGFPHATQERTTIDDFGRIHWRRRHTEDCWVVSYCPALLLFADCHFHFDVVFTSMMFSYLYKYFFKGPDVAFYSISHEPTIPAAPSPINEVKAYQKARYLSAPESAWRILGFETTRKEPSVDCLPVHLPGENIPQFRQRDGEQSHTSLLLRYFLRAPELHELTYEQYYEQYILYNYDEQQPLQERDHLERPHPCE